MLDQKQRRLINSWQRLAKQQSKDPYMTFMALWIAFNAYCYAHYANIAHRERADIRRAQGFDSLTDAQQPIGGTIQRINNRITIDLKAPTAIKIVIGEKYTEDHIFTRFAEQHADTYTRLLQDETFRDCVARLQQALKKTDDQYYVVNMARQQNTPETKP